MPDVGGFPGFRPGPVTRDQAAELNRLAAASERDDNLQVDDPLELHDSSSGKHILVNMLRVWDFIKDRIDELPDDIALVRVNTPDDWDDCVFGDCGYVAGRIIDPTSFCDTTETADCWLFDPADPDATLLLDPDNEVDFPEPRIGVYCGLLDFGQGERPTYALDTLFGKPAWLKWLVVLETMIVSGAVQLQSTLDVTGTTTVRELNVLGDGSLNLKSLSGVVTNILKFWNAGSTQYVGFRAPALSGNQVWTLPTGDSSGSQALTSNGSGVLSFVSYIPLSYLDTDTTLAANSDAKVPSQKAIKTYVDNAVTSLWEIKGSTDASANPNYPAAVKGDAYIVTVAGKVGGASGKSVDVGDWYVAIADNAGGDEASVGTSWAVIEHNVVAAALTKVDDTNVTLTLTGTPASSLLQAVTITAGWTGTLALSRLAQGTDGQLIVGQTSAAPSYKTVSGDATLAATGALTLASVITAGGPTGDATTVPIITWDAKGRLTAVSSTTITPAVGSITGLGTGVATALAVNVGSAGAFVTFNGAGGTPSSMTATNLTGTASGLTAGTVTTNANLTGEVTSVGNAATLDKTAITNRSQTDIDWQDSLLVYDLSGTAIIKQNLGRTLGPLATVCGGRLSLTTAVPITAADVTAALLLYFTSMSSSASDTFPVPTADGTRIETRTTAELSIKVTDSAQTGTMTSGNKIISGLTSTAGLCINMAVTGTSVGASAKIVTIDSPTQVTVDVNSTGSTTNAVTFKVPASTMTALFLVQSGSSAIIKQVPWSSTTSRGAGATNPALGSLNGVVVNNADITDGTNILIAAKAGVHLGDYLTTATAGQVSDADTHRGLSNRYNPVPRRLFTCPAYADDNAQTVWTTTSTTWVQANGGTGSRVNFIVQKGDLVQISGHTDVANSGANASRIGVNFDSTTDCLVMQLGGTTTTQRYNLNVHYESQALAEGAHTADLMASVSAGTGTYIADTARNGATADPFITFLLGFCWG